MTSHAAVVTRGMGKCCVAGAGDCVVDEAKKELRVKGQDLQAGRLASRSTAPPAASSPASSRPSTLSPTIPIWSSSWAGSIRSAGCRSAPTPTFPATPRQARAFGAEGIGLCRTEHMFFAEDRIEHMRAMILADNEKDRRAALKKLLPMQRADFAGLFKAMESLPGHHPHCSIRRCTSSCPSAKICWSRSSTLNDTKPRSPKLKELRTLLARVEELHEQNPMLGLRGCRLGIAFPEITEMQARAIIEAAVCGQEEGRRPASRDHDPAHRLHRGDAQPGRHHPPRRRRGLQGEGHARSTTWSAP